MCLSETSMFLSIFKSLVKWSPSFLRIAVGGGGGEGTKSTNIEKENKVDMMLKCTLLSEIYLS